MSALPPLLVAEVKITIGPEPGDCRVICPRQLSLREHLRILRAAKKAINNELFKLHKDSEQAMREYGGVAALDMPYWGFVFPRELRDMLAEVLAEYMELAAAPAR